jgi:hypothetical protein
LGSGFSHCAVHYGLPAVGIFLEEMNPSASGIIADTPMNAMGRIVLGSADETEQSDGAQNSPLCFTADYW